MICTLHGITDLGGIRIWCNLAHILDVVLAHDFNEVDGAQNVVVIVEPWLLDRLPHSFPPREVNYSIKAAYCRHCLAQLCIISGPVLHKYLEHHWAMRTHVQTTIGQVKDAPVLLENLLYVRLASQVCLQVEQGGFSMQLHW